MDRRMLVTSEREVPMNYLQIEINVDYHRERLRHEAEMERMASQLRSASVAVTDQPKNQQRRALAMLWRRTATQTA